MPSFAGINLKLPEHLFTKNDLNKDVSFKQGRFLAVLKTINLDIESEFITKAIGIFEDQQPNIGGKRLDQYSKLASAWNEANAERANINNNK